MSAAHGNECKHLQFAVVQCLSICFPVWQCDNRWQRSPVKMSETEQCDVSECIHIQIFCKSTNAILRFVLERTTLTDRQTFLKIVYGEVVALVIGEHIKGKITTEFKLPSSRLPCKSFARSYIFIHSFIHLFLWESICIHFLWPAMHC